VKKIALLNLLGFAVMITVNALANILPIAGRTTGGVSAFTDNLFVPAGFTFSIWGLIYLLLAAFVFTALIAAKNPVIAGVTSRIGSLFFISCLLNSAWLFAWHHLQLIPSMILMVGLLVTLLAIYVRLENEGIADRSFASLTMRLPFRVYVGWISVATIANMAAVLTFYGFSGFGIDPQIWTATMVTVAALLGITMLFKSRDFAYPAVIIWALWGIYNKRTADTETADQLVEKFCLIMIGLLVTGMIVRLLKPKAPRSGRLSEVPAH
jgi:hypothetical protein